MKITDNNATNNPFDNVASIFWKYVGYKYTNTDIVRKIILVATVAKVYWFWV